MPDFTHYYGLLHDGHGRGRQNILVVDPGSVTPNGQLLTITSAPTPAVELGVVARGATSGSAGIVRRIINATQFVLEAIENQLLPLPPGGAFSQQNTGPLTGETINFDNGGTSTVAPFGDSQLAPGFGQWIVGENDAKYTDLLPGDASDTPFWDRQAKVAQLIRCNGVSGNWRKGDRFTSSGGGAATVLLATVVGAELHLRVIRKTGTALAAAQTLTNTTVAGAATIVSVDADPPSGVWVPYCPLPNLRGLGTYYETTPKGNGTDGNGSGLGVETRLMHAIAAHHATAPSPNDRRWRFLPFSSFDPPAGALDGILGGVTVQVVKCSGTFPATGVMPTAGATVSAGGWSGTFLGAHVGLKYLYVRKTNGATLASGTVTASNGATFTATGPAFGWAKGSTHWNNWVAQKNAATTAPASDGSPIGATWPGSTQRWEGLVLMPWETELAVHSVVNQCPFATDAQVREAWIQWAADLRTELGRADLPLTVWTHRKESQAGAVPVAPGVGYAYFLRQILLSLPQYIARLTAFDSEQLGCEMAAGVDSTTYLRNADYRDRLSVAAWRHLQFGQVTVPPGDGFTALPVGIMWGQSNATGFIPAGLAMAVDRDPDLWPSPSGFPVSSVDANALIWNPVTQQLEPYAADVNANGSWGTAAGTCGPEVPLVARMKFRYSDSATNSAKFALFKFTVPGSAIQADVPDAVATWDPALSARPMIVGSFTVTAHAAGALPQRGRFTGTAGTFDPLVFVVTKSTTIAGSALGSLGFGGNNTLPYAVARVVACDPAGAWVEIEGPFVAEGPRTYTIAAGPPPILPELRAQWASFVSRCRDLGYVPVPCWTVGVQSESDLNYVGGYAAKLEQLYEAFDVLFGLRVKGQPKLPAVLALQTTETSWGCPDENITQMRGIQTAFAATRTAEGGATTTAETRDLPMEIKDANVVRTTRHHNGLHFTARGLITLGFRLDRELFTLGAVPAHPKGEVAVDDGAVNGGTDDGSADAGGEDGGGVDGPEEGSGTDGPLEPLSTEQAAVWDEAVNGAPDVAGWSITREGKSVQRRSLRDMREHLQALAADAARRRGSDTSFADLS